MGKIKNTILGLGMATMLGASAFTVGCADMTDTQVKDALDTAVKAEQTLEELKDLYQNQNTEYNAQIQKLQAELDEFQEIMKDKSGQIDEKVAAKMIEKSIMDFEVMSKDMRNVKVNVEQLGSHFYVEDNYMTGIISFFMDNNNKVYIDIVTKQGNQNGRLTKYGDINSFIEVNGSQKTTQNASIHGEITGHFLSTLNLGGLRGITEENINSAYKNTNGDTIIVVFENADDYYKMFTLMYDNNNRLINLEINMKEKSESGSIDGATTEIQYSRLSYDYGAVTEEEVAERVAEMNAME